MDMATNTTTETARLLGAIGPELADRLAAMKAVTFFDPREGALVAEMAKEWEMKLAVMSDDTHSAMLFEFAGWDNDGDGVFPVWSTEPFDESDEFETVEELREWIAARI